MGYYECIYQGISGNAHAWLIVPAFTPRKAEFGSMLKKTAADGESTDKQDVKELSEETKAELREKLHNGRGDMTLQEWDDFLADLVELAIITNTERSYANGSMSGVPKTSDYVSPEDRRRFGPNPMLWSENGLTFPKKQKDDMWTGDPLKFLNKLDVYTLRNAASSGTMDIAASEREAMRRVTQILQEILW
ncbi:hypothetical protein D3Z48_06290 [Clostridiaceae bacterium]|nr:hypothetical protein [Clostridiaceae bacterium]